MTHHLEDRERRNASRKQVELDVELYRGRSHLGLFKARNINYRGMFVETGPLNLNTDDQVEVGVSLNLQYNQQYRLKGIVEHRSEKGVGLLFTDSSSVAFHTLRVLLFNSSADNYFGTHSQAG
jgi:hypothetical protein